MSQQRKPFPTENQQGQANYGYNPTPGQRPQQNASGQPGYFVYNNPLPVPDASRYPPPGPDQDPSGLFLHEEARRHSQMLMAQAAGYSDGIYQPQLEPLSNRQQPSSLISAPPPAQVASGPPYDTQRSFMRFQGSMGRGARFSEPANAGNEHNSPNSAQSIGPSPLLSESMRGIQPPLSAQQSVTGSQSSLSQSSIYGESIQNRGRDAMQYYQQMPHSQSVVFNEAPALSNSAIPNASFEVMPRTGSTSSFTQRQTPSMQYPPRQFGLDYNYQTQRLMSSSRPMMSDNYDAQAAQWRLAQRPNPMPGQQVRFQQDLRFFPDVRQSYAANVLRPNIVPQRCLPIPPGPFISIDTNRCMSPIYQKPALETSRTPAQFPRQGIQQGFTTTFQPSGEIRPGNIASQSSVHRESQPRGQVPGPSADKLDRKASQGSAVGGAQSPNFQADKLRKASDPAIVSIKGMWKGATPHNKTDQANPGKSSPPDKKDNRTSSRKSSATQKKKN